MKLIKTKRYGRTVFILQINGVEIGTYGGDYEDIGELVAILAEE